MSVMLFVISSWLCGFAWSLESLVAFRVLQGAVAGPMIPLSQSLMLGTYPKDKAGMALALWSMTILVGPVAGPLLGGWISDNYNWPWIFYINVRSEEHTSELQSLMRISYAVFCLTKKHTNTHILSSLCLEQKKTSQPH